MRLPICAPVMIGLCLLGPACDKASDGSTPAKTEHASEQTQEEAKAAGAANVADDGSKTPKKAAGAATKAPRKVTKAETKAPPPEKEAEKDTFYEVEPASDAPDPPPRRDVLKEDGFDFEPVAFDTALPLKLEVPKRPSGKRVASVTPKVSRAKLGEALGLTTADEHGLVDPDLMPGWFTREPNALVYDQESDLPEPLLWWPSDGHAVLVVPVAVVVGGKAPALTLVLARKDGDTWKGSLIHSWTESHEEVVAEADDGASLNSAAAMRHDELALHILTHIEREGITNALHENVCLVRWDEDALAWACSDSFYDGRM